MNSGMRQSALSWRNRWTKVCYIIRILYNRINGLRIWREAILSWCFYRFVYIWWTIATQIHLIFFYLLFLTGEILKVLNRFYKRKEMQKLAADQGLDGENHWPMIIITWSYIINIGQPWWVTWCPSKNDIHIAACQGYYCILFVTKHFGLLHLIKALLFICSSTARLFHQAFVSFRKYVLEMNALNADLHIILSDICCGAGEYLLKTFNWQYP